MTLADAIASSTSASVTVKATTANRKTGTVTSSGSSNKNNEDRPRNNSPAFQAYEDKKNACDARIADIRARLVNYQHIN